MVLIFISSMPNDVEHTFVDLLAIYIYSLVKCLHMSFAQFLTAFFSYCVLTIFCMFWLQLLYLNGWFANISYPVCSLSFYLCNRGFCRVKVFILMRSLYQLVLLVSSIRTFWLAPIMKSYSDVCFLFICLFLKILWFSVLQLRRWASLNWFLYIRCEAHLKVYFCFFMSDCFRTICWKCGPFSLNGFCIGVKN